MLISLRSALMFDIRMSQSWPRISSLDGYFQWRIGSKRRPQWKPLSVHNVKQTNCLHISSYIPGSRGTKRQWKVKHILNRDGKLPLFLLDMVTQTADRRFTTPPYFVPLSFSASSQLTQVETSCNYICSVFSVSCEKWGREFGFSCPTLFPWACAALIRSKFVWWVHPAKSGKHTLHLYRFELF